MTKTVPLGDTATFVNGYPFKPTDWKESGLPIIRIQDLTGNAYATNYFSGKIPDKYYVKNGDVLISWSASLGIYEWQKGEAVLNQHIFKVVFNKLNIDKQYFKHVVGHKLGEMAALTHGATMKHITKGDFDNLKIPLPSLDEQRRIAALLDSADALRQKDRQLLAHYDQLAQSLFLDLFGDPVRNEKGWTFMNLRSTTNFITDGPFGSNLKTEHYRMQGIRVIRLTNVGVGIFLEKDEAFVAEDHYERILKKHTCLPGDLVIATLGEPNLRACIVPEHIGIAINKADVILCRPNPKIISTRYLNGLINHPSMLTLASNLLHGQTRVRISMGQLAALEIPVPPLPLQNHFANLIEQIEKQKAVVRQQMAASEALFGRLLQECFG